MPVIAQREFAQRPRRHGEHQVVDRNIQVRLGFLDVGQRQRGGGETPLGFDCSGYVMFIYSQFGVALPHSVYQQAKLAKKIKLEDAVPGDIVVFNDYSHNGIYAGNGNFYHAPQPGDRVKLAPIFTERYHFVRFVDIKD